MKQDEAGNELSANNMPFFSPYSTMSQCRSDNPASQSGFVCYAIDVCTKFHTNPSTAAEIFQSGIKWWTD